MWSLALRVRQRLPYDIEMVAALVAIIPIYLEGPNRRFELVRETPEKPAYPYTRTLHGMIDPWSSAVKKRQSKKTQL